MEIIVEYLIIDNYVMNYLIVKLLEKTTGETIFKKRKFLVCSVGTLFAFVLPYLTSCQPLSFCFKICVSIILVLMLKKYKNIKVWATYYCLFIAYTFLIGGACLGVINLLGISYTSSSIIFYSYEFPVGVFVILFMLCIRLIFVVIDVAKKTLVSSSYKYKVKLEDREKRIECRALYDSGNSVVCEGEDVSIMSLSLFLNMYKDMDVLDFLMGKDIQGKLRDFKYVDVSGLGNSKKYISFLIDKMIIRGRVFKNVRLAVVMKNFENFDLILNKNVFVR